jgi:hypothetical protein
MLVVALLTNLTLTPVLVWWVRPFGRDAPAGRLGSTP